MLALALAALRWRRRHSALDGDACDGGKGIPTRDEPIKFQFIASRDNPYFDSSSSIPGAEAAADAINVEGGIGRRPIEILPCNDLVDPQQSGSLCLGSRLKDGGDGSSSPPAEIPAIGLHDRADRFPRGNGLPVPWRHQPDQRALFQRF